MQVKISQQISKCAPSWLLKNCSNFLIFISGNVTWTGSEGDRRDGKKIEVFIFLFFFVNRFVDCFFLYSFYHLHY